MKKRKFEMFLKDIDKNEEKNYESKPYYSVFYLDDDNKRHLAKVKEAWHLQFLKERYRVIEYKQKQESFDNYKK